MMTEIHAKPSRSSRTEPELPEGFHSGTSGTRGDTAGKKRPVDKSSVSGTATGIEKKKKDKKKALKRL